MNIIVIGGGASGLMAAIKAASNGAAVTIIENQKKTGRKLSTTGNGKCNFTNEKIKLLNDKNIHDFYFGDGEFILNAFSHFDVDDTIRFFNRIGVRSYMEPVHKGYYPMSNSASSVTDALTDYAFSLGVKIKTNNYVKSVKKTECGFIVDVGIELLCDRLIVATGGNYEISDGLSGYRIAEQFGHTVSELKPALTAFVAKDLLNKASGTRFYGTLYIPVIYENDTGAVPKSTTPDTSDSCFADEDDPGARYIICNNPDGIPTKVCSGEIQITDYGLSGIPVFDASHFVDQGDRIYINFIPKLLEQFDVDVSISDSYEKRDSALDKFAIKLFDELYTYNKKRTVFQVLKGMISEKILEVIYEKIQLSKTTDFENIAKEDFIEIFRLLSLYPIHIIKRRGFDFAQVTQGGIMTNEINSDTMKSRLCEGLYFAGEILDVSGICGGYNLQWAWTSGSIAGENSSK